MCTWFSDIVLIKFWLLWWFKIESKFFTNVKTDSCLQIQMLSYGCIHQTECLSTTETSTSLLSMIRGGYVGKVKLTGPSYIVLPLTWGLPWPFDTAKERGKVLMWQGQSDGWSVNKKRVLAQNLLVNCFLELPYYYNCHVLPLLCRQPPLIPVRSRILEKVGNLSD